MFPFIYRRIKSKAGASKGIENESVLSSFGKALTDLKLILLITYNIFSQA